MNISVMDKVSPDEVEAVRAEVRAIIAEEGLAQSEIARETGIGYSTFAAWLNGTYKGHNEVQTASVQRWLETRKERKRTHAALPAAPSFVATPTAQAIINTLAFAQAAPDFGVIVGGAGVGKTTALEEYKTRATNVFVVTSEPCHASPNNMMMSIALALGLVEQRNARISGAIVSRLKGAAGLLVIDEAQHLSTQALDQLRTIHDLAKCGIVVSGNESVFARLQGGEARGAQFAQLHSRVGMRVVQPQPRARDICAIVQAWGLDPESAEAKLLKTIARKPGALRGLTKTMRLAGMIAGADAPITAKHIRQAWAQLSAVSLDDAA